MKEEVYVERLYHRSIGMTTNWKEILRYCKIILFEEDLIFLEWIQILLLEHHQQV
jgi:hypothetical protein